MTYEKPEPLEGGAYKWSEGEDNYIYRGFTLPCDVRLPPNTVVRAGCSLQTLLLALTLEGRPTHFDRDGVIHERGFGPGDGDSRIAQPQSGKGNTNG